MLLNMNELLQPKLFFQTSAKMRNGWNMETMQGVIKQSDYSFVI